MKASNLSEDMIVIVGGGPAGRLAALRLAHAGKDVLLINRGALGGQCLHHGCMVVCALNDVARLLNQSRLLCDLGVFDAPPRLTFKTLLAEMKEIQKIISRVLLEETRSAGVTILEGEGSVDGRSVTADGEELDADAILIATGSRPVIPDIPGIDISGVYTPHTLQNMEDLPERLAIIGGGIVSAEYAYIFQGLGSAVTILSRSRFLKGLEDRVQKNVRIDLAGVSIHENVTFEEIRSTAGGMVVAYTRDATEEELEVDAVMVSAGLQPRTERIFGIPKGVRGEILVDVAMRTGVEGVYAAGDVTGPPYLTPVARKEGIVAADTILGRKAGMDYSYIPQSIKLQYEHSFCRETDEDAVTMSMPSPSGSGSFWWVPRRYTGLSSLSVNPENGKIAGIYAAAPGTSLMATYLAYLMHHGITVYDLEELLEVHPSTDGIYGLIRYAAEWLKKGQIR
jgi:dihydrolipoamide dehydrogenase